VLNKEKKISDLFLFVLQAQRNILQLKIPYVIIKKFGLEVNAKKLII